MKRTRKLRLELQFNGQTAIQVYDGVNGWKMRPFLNRTDYEPYTADETKAASEQADLDGPLVDYAAKGTIVELAGMEKVNGRDNYRLKLTLKSGYSFHVWIDAQTFLESKIEGTPRRLRRRVPPGRDLHDRLSPDKWADDPLRPGNEGRNPCTRRRKEGSAAVQRRDD